MKDRLYSILKAALSITSFLAWHLDHFVVITWAIVMFAMQLVGMFFMPHKPRHVMNRIRYVWVVLGIFMLNFINHVLIAIVLVMEVAELAYLSNQTYSPVPEDEYYMSINLFGRSTKGSSLYGRKARKLKEPTPEPLNPFDASSTSDQPLTESTHAIEEDPSQDPDETFL